MFLRPSISPIFVIFKSYIYLKSDAKICKMSSFSVCVFIKWECLWRYRIGRITLFSVPSSRDDRMSRFRSFPSLFVKVQTV